MKNAEWLLSLAEVYGITEKNNLALYQVLKEAIHNIEDEETPQKTAHVVLEQSGITPQSYPMLYEAVTKTASEANELAAVFKFLREVGATPEKDERLYQGLIKKLPYVSKFTAAFLALSSIGATPEKNGSLYQYVIDMPHPSYYSNAMATVFKLLLDAGVSLEKDEAFYQTIIYRSGRADELAAVFKVLSVLGATFEENEVIYRAILDECRYGDKLAIAFQVLAAEGAMLKQHESLYLGIIEKAAHADEMVTAFKSLSDIGATLEKNSMLYQEAITYPHGGHTASLAFEAVKSIGATLKKDEELYQAALHYAAHAHRMKEIFLVLASVGATLERHSALYQVAIENIYFADGKLVIGFSLLAQAGATLEQHALLYQEITKNIDRVDDVAAVFNALTHIGATLVTHSTLYKLAIYHLENGIIPCLNIFSELGLHASDPTHTKIMEQILKTMNPDSTLLLWLQTSGFKARSHLYLYKALFIDGGTLICTPFNLARVQSALDEFLNGRKVLNCDEDGYQAQSDEIIAVIQKATDVEAEITQGPLSASSATLTLEMLLKQIANTDVDKLDMRYDESFGYLLQVQGQPDIYINELLKLVNFEHIRLTDEDIAKLGNIINQVANGFSRQKISSANSVVNQLPEAVKSALGCYIGDAKYKNINRLFRGIPQTTEDQYTWISPGTGKNNLLANFLCGCLVNWAAVQLPRLQIHSEEILFPEYLVMDRGENLKDAEQDGYLGVSEARQANPIHTSSVMSVSILPAGSPFFHHHDTQRITFERDKNRSVINEEEGEALIPHGTVHRFIRNPAGGFFARELNSPGIIPLGGYWSSIAIAEAYRHHLSFAYKEASNSITIDGKTVQRPNHGLAHEYRVMAYIDIVINYFSLHAKDPEFRLFCQWITFEEREWLRVAAAYSITGRESEMAAGENLKKYNQFRNASHEHMISFLQNFPPKVENEAMRDRMLHIVRWMGNPMYETDADNKLAINQHEDLDEWCHRNFIHRILTVSHKLDLPRCYDPNDFEKAMSQCRDLSLCSEKQQIDYLQMIEYAINLIRAHGNALCMRVGNDGRFVPYQETYRAPFDKVSTNLRQLREMTDTVPRLSLTEAYQFTDDEDEELKQKILTMCGIEHPERPHNGLELND
ncbi:MAG: SidE phosphodiesterase domain-containing protein [Legionella sp.]|uniref:SidE phosphodiesterase domain-containing protein n=1 Tax=Legionella sp. TaxID=459 RepID=UPI00284C423F|nr:SidE phosphodiesterase domain-containing protein [Legionella sp.]